MRILLLLFSLITLITSAQVNTGNADSWISKTVVENNERAAKDVSQGSYLQLFEKQVHVVLQKEYTHFKRLLINEKGVQNNSEINIQFDPAYQKLTIHHIWITRNGESKDVLKRSQIKVVKEEEDLARFLYNGTYSAIYILEDVRVNDVIEYDYTISGFNPVFRNKFYKDFYTQFDSPIGAFYYSVIIPKNRKLNIKQFNNAPEFKLTENKDGSNKYEWKIDRVPPFVPEGNTPSWFEASPYVQISEMNDWSEVINWGLSINPNTDLLSNEIKKKVSEFKNSSKNELEYFKLCTRFVQDEIRYMGIETSSHSHEPHSPSQTFRQRYGDCKDKSLLLCALLNANKIEASPVYINTRYRSHVTDLIPSPLNFNHCVCWVKIGNTEFWIDPTISLQRGPIESQYFPNYGVGLVISKGQTDFKTIPLHNYGKTKINEVYTISKIKGKGKLEVVSTYNAGEADNMRDYLQDLSLNELESDYLDYYSKRYESIEKEKDVEIKDDVEANIIEIREYYTLPLTWEKEDDSNIFLFNTYAGYVNQVIGDNSNKKRNTPYKITYPVEVEFSIEVNLPEDWDIGQTDMEVNNDYFKFRYISANISKGILLRYNYTALKSSVASSDISSYSKDVDKIKDILGYEISWDEDVAHNQDTAKENESKGIPTFIFLVAIFSFIAFRIYKLRIETNEVQRYFNIGGWMIIPLVILPINLIFQFFNLVNIINSEGSAQPDNFRSIIFIGHDDAMLIEFLAASIILVYSVLCLVAFINRRDILRPLIIWFYTFSLIKLAFEILFVNQYVDGIPTLTFKPVLLLLINATCLLYFLFSKRVKGTFVMHYGELFYRSPLVGAFKHDKTKFDS